MSGKYPLNFLRRVSAGRFLSQIGAAIARTLLQVIDKEGSLIPIPVRAVAARRGSDQRRRRD
jgi:hypothetical protein